ncbi:MAG: DUF996 domain-containing protein [Thermoplasmata archaeon]|nr:DUF996 domain-containing protein [Thermoplasmata archaeon]
MSLDQAKTYGGVGAILSLIGGFIPYAGIIVSIAGVILILIAVKNLSTELKDSSIMNNYILYFVISIIAGIVAIASFIAFIGVDVIFNVTKVESELHGMDALKHIIVGLLIALVALWILMIIASSFLKKSYYSIADKTGVEMFHTTGLLYFVGAVTIIVIVGAIIIFIAKILEIIAYFSLPDEISQNEELQE